MADEQKEEKPKKELTPSEIYMIRQIMAGWDQHQWIVRPLNWLYIWLRLARAIFLDKIKNFKK